MREQVPSSISDTAYDLTPDSLVELFKLELLDVGNTVVFFTAQDDFTWLGDLYEKLPCKLTGVSQNADGESSRPRIAIANPQAIFSSQVQSGAVDGATLTQYRILKADLDLDLDVKLLSQWRVSRVITLNLNNMVLEMRTILDGQSFKLPARTFFPPEFPHVSLR